jgi:2-keto-4-pentenoate hydratase
MHSTAIDSAAQLLFDARTSQRTIDRLPPQYRPADGTEGLAIQRRVGALLGQPVGGWKCSVPTDERKMPLAPIFSPAIHEESPCGIVAMSGMARIEPEIAFVVGRDLPPRATPYTDEEIRASMREVRLVLELIGPRYTDPAVISFPELLADNVANQGLFVGPVVEDALSRPLGAFAIAINGPTRMLLTREGKHPDGHPLPPLYWLANFLSRGGYGKDEWLRAGQVVTTGSYCGVVDVPLNADLDVRFGGLGTLPVRFSALESPGAA